MKTPGHVTNVLLSDGGKEFNCEVVQKVLEEYGIKHRLTMSYTLKQNRAAGRKWYSFGKHSLYAPRQWIAERSVG
jgi:hypothetical protein